MCNIGFLSLFYTIFYHSFPHSMCFSLTEYFKLYYHMYWLCKFLSLLFQQVFIPLFSRDKIIVLISLCRSLYHPHKTVENTAYFSHISMNTSNATLQHCFVFMLVYHASPGHLWRDSGEPRIKPLRKHYMNATQHT
jgi:hypothetical protein